jgi:hypothetical protein
MSTNRCALYCKVCAKYSAHPPDYAMWTVVADIYNVITAAHIQAKIFNWTYLLCYWRCLDKSMHVIMQTLCQIQRTSPSLRYVNCGPDHIQCNYSFAYLGFIILLNVSALLLEICRHFDEHYSANRVAKIRHIPQFTLCELWSRSYAM